MRDDKQLLSDFYRHTTLRSKVVPSMVEKLATRIKRHDRWWRHLPWHPRETCNLCEQLKGLGANDRFLNVP